MIVLANVVVMNPCWMYLSSSGAGKSCASCFYSDMGNHLTMTKQGNPASVWKIIIGVNLHCSFVTVCLEHA